MLPLSTAPWSVDAERVAEELTSDLEHGLTEEEAKKRSEEYGENIFREDKTRSPFAIFWAQLKNPLVIVLGIATVLTLSLSEYLDSAIIFFAIVVNAVLGFVQEFKAERAIASLRSYILERTRVIRNGREFEIDARFLVPGDVVHLTHGVRITADMRIVSQTDFSTDESILTGESLPENKFAEAVDGAALLADRTNMAYAGTLVVGGNARAIVTATGYQTEIGKLAQLVTDTQTEKTPLQIAIERLTQVIIIVITVVVSIVFIVGIMQEQPLYEMLLLSIAIIVGAVPEALPIGVTAVLAIGVQQIAKRNGIMRSLTAAETLGSTTLIMTDKTGTLTQANMQLVGISPLTSMLTEVPEPSNTNTEYELPQLELLRLALANTDVVIENPDAPAAEWKLSGAILEKNIVRVAALQGIRFATDITDEIHLRIPFSSEHKFSVAKIPTALLPGGLEQYEDPHVVLGAPDILLARAYMDKDTFLKAEAAIERYSNEGKRLLGVALVTPRPQDGHVGIDDIQNITFLGILSFYDPIRADVPAALTRIESYGIRVVMATGDLPGTAAAIARDLGWEIEAGSIITGSELRQLTDEELSQALTRVRIFARVTPEDKLRVTQLYQSRGEVVAMTGDGVNDGPSLKAANIGIAVGSGSDVAKDIADLILLDDSFNTIVATIEEGKRMLVNIKKTIVYLMSNSLDGVILIGGSVLAGVAMPLTAIQIIWVNLFTGSIPAIAYAFDRQPISRNDRSHKFFDPTVKILTVGVGVISSLLLFVLYTTLLRIEALPLETVRSIVFACFGSYILIIALSFRNLREPIYSYPLFDNKVLIFGLGLGFLLMLATIYLPLFQGIFGTVALSPWWLGFVVIWLICNVLLVELAKFFARYYPEKP